MGWLEVAAAAFMPVRWVLTLSAQLNGAFIQFVGGYVSMYTSPVIFSSFVLLST